MRAKFDVGANPIFLWELQAVSSCPQLGRTHCPSANAAGNRWCSKALSRMSTSSIFTSTNIAVNAGRRRRSMWHGKNEARRYPSAGPVGARPYSLVMDRGRVPSISTARVSRVNFAKARANVSLFSSMPSIRAVSLNRSNCCLSGLFRPFDLGFALRRAMKESFFTQ